MAVSAGVRLHRRDKRHLPLWVIFGLESVLVPALLIFGLVCWLMSGIGVEDDGWDQDPR